MRHLQQMAHEARHVVLAVVHQPRAAIWATFDALTIVAHGRLLYTGPREGMLGWFGHLGYPYDAGLHGVPSDFVMDLVCVGFAKPSVRPRRAGACARCAALRCLHSADALTPLGPPPTSKNPGDF